MDKIINDLRNFFNTNNTKSFEFRLNNLKKLLNIVKANEDKIYEALYKDLNKSKEESYLSELGLFYKEINYFIKNLKRLMKPKKVKTSNYNFKSIGYVYNEPYGLTLIITPWNYPFYLPMVSLIASIATGNVTLMKLSSLSINTSKLLEDLINNNFENNYIFVITDDKFNKDLLKFKYDKIFFTGSTNVGKLYYDNASKNLTPITLELGGKSPVIIDKNCNIELSCKRIVFGKLLNAGQTCIAPDYILVPRYNYSYFIKRLKETFDKFLDKEELPKIINERHFVRLTNYLNEGKIIYGGDYDRNTLKIYPTLITELKEEDKLLNEEIFGPILPIIIYENIEDAIKIINKKPKPLAFYLFSNNNEIVNKVLNEISFGNGCINDTIMQISENTLPFGGVSESGIGRYLGKESFKTFSNQKSILQKSIKFDFDIRYQPFKNKLEKYKKLIK